MGTAARHRPSGAIRPQRQSFQRALRSLPFDCARPANPRVALAAVLLAAAVLRLWLLARDVPTLNSDEATVGLMALHILHGQWTVFYWGQSYMGSLEAILAAPWIALFGPTSFALHLAPLLAGLGFLTTVYALGEQLFSRRVGLVSAGLLAVGPPFFVVLSLRALGGYPETLLFGNLLLLLALRGRQPARQGLRDAALFGLIGGLALWTNLLVIPYLLAAGAIFWWQRRTDLRGRNGVALTLGLLVGAAPALVYNLLHSGVTVTTILGLTLLGTGGHTSAPAASLPQAVVRELFISLPILAGSFLPGNQVSGLTAADFWRGVSTHPVAYALDLLLAAVALALLVSLAIPILRDRRELRDPADPAPQSAIERPMRLTTQGTVALLLVLACYAAAFALSKASDIATSPRYLFPLYAGMPLLVAAAGRLFCRPARSLRFRAAFRSRWAAAPALAPLIALLVWSLAGTLALAPADTAARDHNIWIAGSDYALARLLHAHHVTAVISNDYWEGLRLTYSSGESVIAVMVTPEGHPGFNRYPPYISRGLADPRPAYLELTGTPEERLDAARFASGKLPGYTSVVVGQFTVLVPA
jgi:4-amino-4-deoxy-L-arabinose transferase-like glycosyltransferase